jgi:hypothetical protein
MEKGSTVHYHNADYKRRGWDAGFFLQFTGYLQCRRCNWTVGAGKKHHVLECGSKIKKIDCDMLWRSIIISLQKIKYIMENLKHTKTETQGVSGTGEKARLSPKTILKIDGDKICLDKEKKNRFAFFVKSPVNQTFTVDWGDGEVCRYDGSERRILLSHKYASQKTFVVTIQGIITTLICNIYDPIGIDEISENGFGVATCDMRGNPHIEALECGGKLLLRNNYSLRELYRFAVGINGRDLAQLPALECIEFMDSFYTGALDFSHNPKLKYLRCPCNEDISALNVSGCPDLEYLDICYAERCRLDLENNHKLKYLFACGIEKENIRLPEGRTIITDHECEIPEKYWTLWND